MMAASPVMASVRTRPVAVDGGDLGVVALVLGPAGDVLDRAVGVVGVDGELLPAVARSMTRCSGKTVILVTVGSLGVAVGHAGGDPAADELVLVGAELHASCRRRGPCCPVALSRSRLCVRGGREEAPAAGFLHEGVVVELRLEAEQRQRKPFWPLALPWQPPRLQPSLVKIGTIWLAKLIGRFDVASLSALTGDLDGLVAVAWR